MINNRLIRQAMRVMCALALLLWIAATQAGSWTEVILIDTLRQLQAGYLLVQHTGGPWPNSDYCSASNYAVIDPEARGANELYGILVSAHLVHRRVKIYLNGCLKVGPTTSYPIIAQVVVL